MRTSLAKIFFLLPVLLTAQLQETQYRFNKITLEDGLSQSSLVGIIQDHKGYLWFGTYNGLNRYDGYTFKIYKNDPTDTTSISDNGITAIFEDRNGYIWIGTSNGFLNRFDRKTETFKRIKIDDPQNPVISRFQPNAMMPVTLSLNKFETVTAIEEDTLGNLWIGTWGNGLVKYDRTTGEIEHFYYSPFNIMGLSSNNISDVLVDSRGTIWVASYGGGISKGIHRTLLISTQQATRTIDSYLFVSTQSERSDKNHLKDPYLITLFEDSLGNIWIGSYNEGAVFITAEDRSKPMDEIKFYDIEVLTKTNFEIEMVMDFFEDSQNNLWIGTFGKGLFKFDRTQTELLNFRHNPLNSKSILSDEIISVYEDHSGILWVGSHLGGGISKLEKNQFLFGFLENEAGNPNSLSDNVIWAICEDTQQNIWFGTYRSGLDRLNPSDKSFRHFTRADNLTDDHIKSLVIDNFNHLWIGTYSGGLNQINLNTFVVQNYPYKPKNKIGTSGVHIEDIFIENDSTLWIAVFDKGIDVVNFDQTGKIDWNEQKFYSHDPLDSTSLASNKIYQIFKDSIGEIYVATMGGGLNRFNRTDESFKRYLNDPTNDNSLSNDNVIIIQEDNRNNLWIGTYGGGLNKFDRKKDSFERFGVKDGLLTEVVYGILEDKTGNLWLSTDDGIFRFDPVKVSFIQYGKKDGVQSAEFSGGAYAKTKNGEMYFGGVNGVNYFYPDSIKRNTYIPPIVISRINVLDQPVKGEREILTLNYDQNYFSIEFASLDYTSPSENRYAYRLDGLEDNWNYVSASNRIAKYTNLLPGEYTFRVRGSNSTGIWNEEGTVLFIEIKPPFWKTWWFILLLIVLVGGSITLFVTIRIRQLLAIEKLKSKIAADLHDNVGAGLTEISILSELTAHEIGNQNENASKRLNNISETSRSLVANMSDIVWMVNPKLDSLHDLIIRLKDSYGEFLSQLGISFRINKFERMDNVKIPMDYRQNLFLIFKECINNCVKHSRCTRISLDAVVKGSVLKMTLIDNGKGFDISDVKYGNGLQNMKSRAAAIGGKLNINSSPGKGTIISFIGRIEPIIIFSKYSKKIRFWDKPNE